jgi:hypothetical protein
MLLRTAMPRVRTPISACEFESRRCPPLSNFPIDGHFVLATYETPLIIIKNSRQSPRSKRPTNWLEASQCTRVWCSRGVSRIGRGAELDGIA